MDKVVKRVVDLTNASTRLVSTLKHLAKLPNEIFGDREISLVLFEEGRSPTSCCPAALNQYFVAEMTTADTLGELAKMYKGLLLTDESGIMQLNVLIRMLRVAEKEAQEQVAAEECAVA